MTVNTLFALMKVLDVIVQIVQIMRHRTGNQYNDLRETRRPVNYPCQIMLHALKISTRAIFMIKGIAIIKSTANKNSCNSFGDSKIHKPTNTTKVTNMIKAAKTC